MEAFEEVKQAYKKLKASVYYDKTQTLLRKQIAEFEATGDIDSKLFDITLRIHTDWEAFQSEILKEISAVSFPKKIISSLKESISTKKEGGKVIINAPPKQLSFDAYNYFIDMPVEGHILGTLWVMEIGSLLDKELYEKSFGNRLRKEFIDEKKNGNGFSPYLFKHYFEEYEAWWNEALETAKSIMKEDEDALILSMDLSKFYYSVSFSEKEFSEFTKKYEENAKQIKDNPDNILDAGVIKKLNDFVFNVLNYYGKIIYPIYPEFVSGHCLPIGFLPSCILSNYKLKEIDSAFLDRLNPRYYGRYVDDILIVLSVNKLSKIRETVDEKSTETLSSDFLKLYLGKMRQNLKNRIYVELSKNGSSKSSEFFIHLNNKKTNFRINSDKIQSFYFYSERTDALIDSFQQHISENVSEFNMMPREEALDLEKIDQIYNVKRAEVSKFRGVEKMEISKFELSKLIGKQLVTSNITQEYNHRFLKDSLKIFDEFNILNNYTLWENMFAYYIINDKSDYIIEFTKSILKALETIDRSKDVLWEKTKEVSSTLLEHYISSLSRALSLCDECFVEKFIKRMQKDLNPASKRINWFSDKTVTEEIKRYSNIFYETALFDKRLTPIFTIQGLKRDKNCNFKLYKLEDLVELYKLNKIDEIDVKYIYYPFMISPFDIKILRSFLKMLKGEQLESKESEWKKVSELYCAINFDKRNSCTLLDDAVLYVDGEKIDESCGDYNVIRVGKEKKSEIRVALANTNAVKDGLMSVMTDDANRTVKRYNALAEIVNQAIRGNADILILPETYIPFEWLKLISKKALDNNMAIISGVEHLKFKDPVGINRVYNLTATILPFKGEIYRYSFLEFHNKIHYSPSENEIILGYGGLPVEGNSYELFVWNDIWFAPYCCYEITSIKDRSLFQSLADLIIVVECNRDVNYFGSIMESLSRDMHCFCAQVNSSKFGDSRITQPTETERRDLVRTKGGRNNTVIIESIDITSLRNFQLMDHTLQSKNKIFKHTPPDFEREPVKEKIKGKWFDKFFKPTEDPNP